MNDVLSAEALGFRRFQKVISPKEMLELVGTNNNLGDDLTALTTKYAATGVFDPVKIQALCTGLGVDSLVVPDLRRWHWQDVGMGGFQHCRVVLRWLDGTTGGILWEAENEGTSRVQLFGYSRSYWDDLAIKVLQPMLHAFPGK